MDTVSFRSRIDLWVPLVLLGPAGLALWLLAAEYQHSPRPALLIGALVCVLVLALGLWLLLDTVYTLTPFELVVRHGPFRTAIPLSAVREVRRSATPIAGPALSMTRLEIDHGRFDTAIISPRDLDPFIAALLQRNPDIRAR